MVGLRFRLAGPTQAEDILALDLLVAHRVSVLSFLRLPLAFIGLNAQGWYALGQMLLGTGAVAAGIWAIYNFHRTRRQEAARWLQGIFRDFYMTDKFNDVRELLEYNYPELAGPLLERRITDRHVPITADEMRLLQDLDTLLNYFEHVIYLENENHISRNDRQAVFEYWFEIMNSHDRASVRRYAARFSFERVAETLGATPNEHVAVYGSLRDGFGLPAARILRTRSLIGDAASLAGTSMTWASTPDSYRAPAR